jgi:ubiquinone/menaquinone biosynthesis C-methylase UbiE
MTRIRAGLLAAIVLAVVLATAGAVRASARFDREIERLAALLAIGPGSVVADIGAGKGEHAFALARLVGPEGRVYATEIDPELRAKLASAAQSEGLANVVVVEAFADATGLPDGCCDAAYLRHVYHHVSRPEPFLASLQRSLRPGGRLAVIDFRPSFWLAPWTPDDVPEDRGGHGVAPELVSREAEAAGFARAAVDEEWPGGWFVDEFALAFQRR